MRIKDNLVSARFDGLELYRNSIEFDIQFIIGQYPQRLYSMICDALFALNADGWKEETITQFILRIVKSYDDVKIMEGKCSG